MKKIITIIALSITWHSNANAFCNDRQADDLIAKRFGNACVEKMTATGFYDTCGSAVEEVCSDGCYDSLFNPALKPGCDFKYQKALEAPSCEAFLTKTAKEVGCTDTGKYSNIDTSLPDANMACEMESVVALQATCGGSETAPPTCGGPGGGRYICQATAKCKTKFRVGEDVWKPKSYDVAGLSNSAKCKDFDLNKGFADPNVSVGKRVTFKKSNAEKALEDLANPGK